ncbi:dephospho-CoA kinase [Convivina intestini]|uniref:Dephospho-CoA kinase n=1 Tax=Convivina intestini TaxID=1505726 RepID=A0A2U1DCJ2_9LACO|nr:dephospho-CoA kinase [Convivina intestini]PVY85390.1 dephospho-CoA kinase [Convivina intestini]CAH1853067.1 Dephospho-CoA kinase [Convivina intestini]SDB85644.1 dephospho-CoA kinase [Leuconostocaceae bacterium R-53105]
MKVIGLTGGIASGKSSVSALFKQNGLPIVDADRVAREVVEPGTTTLEKIKLAFGPNIIDNGVLNRAALGKVVFSDRAALDQLNEIIQPVIASAIEDKLAFWRLQKAPVVIVDVPLLFERGYDQKDFFDKIVVVTIDPKQQLQRLMERDHLEEMQARQRMASQLDLNQKVQKADYVINNNGDSEHLQEQVLALIKQIKE